MTTTDVARPRLRSDKRRRSVGSPARTIAGIALVLVLVTLPLSIGDRFWLSIITSAGVLAVGAIGLNLVTGYLGEASLGHAFFMGVGAYAGILIGENLEAPLLLWMLGVLAAGAVAGAVAGPLALRVRGGTLLMVTLALVYIGQWAFMNLRDLTGGPSGRSVDLPLAVGPADFAALNIGGTEFTQSQGFAVLVWTVAALANVVVRNIAKSRTGRAMRAIHDNPLAASAAGVSLFRAKLGGFVVSSSLAALAGALYAQQLGYLEPAEFGLMLSIEFFVILYIGGAGTTVGPILGALFVGAIPHLLEKLDGLPFVLEATDPGVGFTASELSSLIFAVLFLVFIVVEPGGLARAISHVGRLGARTPLRRHSAEIGEV